MNDSDRDALRAALIDIREYVDTERAPLVDHIIHRIDTALNGS